MATSQISDTKERARQQWKQLKNIAMKMIHKEDTPFGEAAIAEQYHDKALLLMRLAYDLERIGETGLDQDGILDQLEALVNELGRSRAMI